ncbi:23S rRNA (uracil1939-C5)-methyltransferase [Steroidobacter denitrificans]|uniref:23S rRNA (uracil(1939)-C(5))-methyltransferase RlmD n=1 Tax=Steroidobacter denitrificans TaxID=465721 RepID=A0A127FA51_STEDE|nr:23S rRNA (uracil1939-C5)-methyltransferase [Steroidobacter denitrificans]
METALIADLAHDGRGVAHVDGKAVFIDEALPGERVEWVRLKRGRSFDEGHLVRVLEPSAERVAPQCAHFGICGGCALQHLSPAGQIAFKQRQLTEALMRIGRVTAAQTLAPLQTGVWHYRRRARLGARWVPQKKRTLVGFRERNTSYVADLARCEVLQPPLDALIEPLSQLLSSLSIRDRVPQVEAAAGDSAAALVIRVLAQPNPQDLASLRQFAAEHQVRIHLQPGGYDTVTPLPAADSAEVAPRADALQDQGLLSYRLPGFDVNVRFLPTDFVQINTVLNVAMVERAVALLEPAPGERVLDLYCGSGNFSLPLARRGAQVVGVEGEAALIARARDNARSNGLSSAEFHVANLADEILAARVREGARRDARAGGLPASGASSSQDEAAIQAAWAARPWEARSYDKILLDPPRAGARDVLPLIAQSGAAKVLYVSCHPASLARDAGILVHEHGFRLQAAGVMDMFPHTAHVESMALFTR